MRFTTFCHKICLALPVAVRLTLVAMALQGVFWPHAFGAAERHGSSHQKPGSLNPKVGAGNGDRENSETRNSSLTFDRSCSSNPEWPTAISAFRQYNHRDQAWIEEELPHLQFFFTTESIDQKTFAPIATIEECVHLKGINRHQFIKAYTSANLTLIQQDDYGGEPFFEVAEASGQTVSYISLFQLRKSSFVFTWASDPREP